MNDMSNYEQPDETGRLDGSSMSAAELAAYNEFEEIDVQDSYTTRAIERAVWLERRLNAKSYEDMAEDERADVKLLAIDGINQLNEECPYLGDEVVVSGEVLVARYDVATEQFAAAKVPYKEECVIAKGYHVLLETDANGKNHYVVGHYFLVETLPAVASAAPLIEEQRLLHSFARVGSVDIIADIVEQRHADVLRQTIPNIIDQINDEIDRAGTPAEALQRLRYVVIPDADIYKMPETTIIDLQHYTYDRLGLDEDVPYAVRLKGLIHPSVYNADGKLATENFTDKSPTLFVSPRMLEFGKSSTLQNGECHFDDDNHFLVTFHVIPDNNGQGERDIIVPVRTIAYMRSLREFVPDLLIEAMQ
jgi:hypothetical protein